MQLLVEEPWFSIQHPIQIPTSTGGLATVDLIDMRFEDALKDKALPNRPDAWCAPLPDGSWLLSSGQVFSVKPPGLRELPPCWWEYVYGVHGNTTTKAAKYTREHELSQEQIDARTPFESRLLRALSFTE